ncbi:MAG: outer membrane lipoprotein-sorting protein, partial [Proteobacteria bacterium]|nr:outer membrane lipoprotein-sorting protein [Pseudomonadota bacterium]
YMKEKMNSLLTVKVLSAGILASFAWSVFTLQKLSTEYSFKQFYPSNHPILQTDLEIKRIFQLQEKSPFLFILSLDNGQWLEPSNLSRLKSITDSLAGLDGVDQLIAITTIEGAKTLKNEILIGNVFDRLTPSLWEKAVRENPLMYPLLISSDFRTVIISVTTTATSSKTQLKFFQSAEKVLRSKSKKVQIIAAGVPVMQTQLTQLIRNELSQFIVLGILVFCSLFYILFSHWTAVILALTALVVTQSFSVALLVPFGISMNVILSTLPIIVSVTMMSLLIHTLHYWAQIRPSCATPLRERWTVALQAQGSLILPNFLSTLTTAFGFLALAPSEIPIIRQYGLAVCGILLVLSVYGQLVVLLCLPFINPKMRSWFDRPATWALASLRFPRTFFLVGIGLMLAATFASSRLLFSGKLFDDLPQTNPARHATEIIDQKNGGLVSYDLLLESTKADFWKERSQVIKIKQLTEHLQRDSQIGSVVSFVDFFQEGIPRSQSQISETLFMFTMSAQNPLMSFLTEDGRKTRIMVRYKDVPSDHIEASRAWIRESAKIFFPTVKVKEAGMAVANHTINQAVSRDLVFSFWHPILFIGILLFLVFRSFRLALVACLPNIVPPAILVIAMASTGVVIKPSVALVFAIALGFAFNNTVYILSRFRAQRDIHSSLLQEGNPCLFESIVMFFGFGIFSLSEFSANQAFGAFMMISVVAGFFGDLFFLPAVLKLFPKAFRKTEPLAPDIEPDCSHLSTRAASLAFIFLLPMLISVDTASAKTDASEILKRSQAVLDATDDQARVEMIITEKNGEVKTRKLEIKTSRKNGFSVIAKIHSPADVRGMGFLGQIKEGEEAQWIYLPSSGQVRRVVTGKSKSGLLGSEISPEDLNSQAIKSASSMMIDSKGKYWVIQVTPQKGTSEYSKVISYIDKTHYTPMKVEYFVGKKRKKTVEFKRYKKLGSIFRAQIINVKNHLNGRKTDLKLTNIQVNKGLGPELFSPSALKD